MLLLTSCVSALVVNETYCIALKVPPLEVVNKLATVTTAEAKQWVIDLSKLYDAWDNKKICAILTYIGK